LSAIRVCALIAAFAGCDPAYAALIIECLDCCTCDCHLIAVLDVQSCGGFEGVQTIGLTCVSCY